LRFFYTLILFTPILFGQTIPSTPVDPSLAPLAPPVTAKDRWKWFADATASPANLFGNTFSAGWATLQNNPPEYGTHWEGFGKRYGMAMTGIVTSNLMEIGLGAIWGEDPAYHPAPDHTTAGHRFQRILKFTVVTENRRGQTVPAYARYSAYVGNNFLSNTWRADGEATATDALIRVGYGFLGRACGNAWLEFWPSVKRKVFHRNSAGSLTSQSPEPTP
jgi:hypothetical protein